MSSVHNRYVTRLVHKHRILVFKLDFHLDLLQMTLNVMLLQDSCIRHIRFRCKVIILNITCFLFFSWLFINSLSYINTGPYDFIHGPWEKLETSDKQTSSQMDYPATHPVILSYNKPGGAGFSGMNWVQVCSWTSSYPPCKCILEYGKSIPINV